MPDKIRIVRKLTSPPRWFNRFGGRIARGTDATGLPIVRSKKTSCLVGDEVTSLKCSETNQSESPHVVSCFFDGR